LPEKLLENQTPFEPRAMSDPASLTVLITNIVLSGRSGTEIVTRNLAAGLIRRGHRPIVYTPSPGPIADELRQLSVPVVSDIEQIGKPVDIIHGHHTPVTAVAVARFPHAAAVFVAHDFTAWFDRPPKFPSIRRYLAVDATVADRLICEHGFAPDAVQVLPNAVDLDRFLPGPPLPERPRRALAFAKNLGHLEAITQACKARGIALDSIGQAVGRVVDTPEALLGGYDLVFTSAMSALEAMACGRAVISCDGRGLAGLVTPANYDAWRPLNFGLRTLQRRVTADAILSEIDLYDAAAAAAVSERVRAQAGTGAWLDSIVACYRACIDEHRSQPPAAADWSRATAKYLQDWQPRPNQQWPWLAERQALIERIDGAAFRHEAPALGKPVLFSARHQGAGTHVALRGFSAAEDWGTWTDASEAVLMCRLPQGWQGTLLARFGVRTFLVPQAPRLDVDVLVNGTPLANWRFDLDASSNQRRSDVRLTPAVLGGLDVAWFLFRIKKPRSLLDFGLGTDARRLGLGLVSLTFKRTLWPEWL
jgi:Glycosyltransferase Family 4